MSTKILLTTAGLAGAVIAFGQMSVDAASRKDRAKAPTVEAAADIAETSASGGGTGPDVVVWGIDQTWNAQSGAYRAYSVRTNSCNMGDEVLIWNAGNNQHPVIGQNMYRLREGQNGHARFEQLGQSWLKHGFCALDNTVCGPCQGTGCGSLGIWCSDPYTASRNASQGGAGPKWQVNATTGFFNYPPANPSWSGSVARRLKVLTADVTNNPENTRYFIEAQYVHPQDCPEDGTNSKNNASHREVTLNSSGSFTGYAAGTIQFRTAIFSWKTSDTTVKLREEWIPGLGTVTVASQAYDNGDGTWDYEYAVHNLDVDRSFGSVSVPCDDGVDVTAIGFKGIQYWDGDGPGNVNYDSTPWPGSQAGGAVAWATTPYATNQSANAIRWGTLYNFRFTADSPPVNGDVTLGYFKPGAGGDTYTVVNLHVPDASSTPCTGDIDGDGSVGFTDLTALLAAWGSCPGCPADIDGDGNVGFTDLTAVLAAWGPCP